MLLTSPQSLVDEGRLAFYDIYRTAKLNERESVLVRAKAHEDFPDIVSREPWDGTGVLPDCTKRLTNGDPLSRDFQSPSLQVWHAGLSCHLQPKSNQTILFDVNDANFLNEFNDQRRRQNVNEDGVKYRLFLVYQLPRGTVIPNTIGIECDGPTHVCLYPIGDNIAVSEIDAGLSSFTIDVLKDLQSWRPFAVFKVKGSGFNFPVEFPPDSDVFPYRRWLSDVISFGDSDIAMLASNYTEEYTSGSLTVFEYMSKMLSVAKNYAADCDCDNIEMNLCIIKALSFALNANLLNEKNERYYAWFILLPMFTILLLYRTSFMMKSSTLNGERAERNLALTATNIFESASRTALAIEGGRPVVSAAASIDLLYINAQLRVAIALPFKVYVDGVEVLFDEFEPSPVVEDAEPTVDHSDVCEEIVECYTSQDVKTDHRICIEASNKKALLVKLTEEEYSKLTQECATCFGYTSNTARCKNKRKSLRGEKVWCYHHTNQERDYRKYLTFRDRPEWCVWWEEM